MTSLLDDVLALHQCGFALIPVPLGQKAPTISAWQDLRLDADGLRTAFAVPHNVGLLLGDPSEGIADVDLDAAEARVLADAFLPATNLISGRASSPASHHFYRITSSLKTTRYRDPRRDQADRAVLVELRSTGSQTLLPPSVHPSGETIVWDREGAPAKIDAADLQLAVAHLAACSLLARTWPGAGSRHDAALALGGGLLRAGWDITKVITFIRQVATAAGDPEVEDRLQAVESTASALAQGHSVTGWPTLATLIDPLVVDAVRTWLGIHGGEPEAGTAEVGPSLSAEQRALAIPVPPFPLDVFPPRVARYLADGAATVGCPVDLIAVPFLSYVAAAMGRQRKLAIKRRWIRKATLWTGVVATSGSGKSPADSYARAPLDVLQTEADEQYAEDFITYKRDLARWKAADANDRGDEPLPPIYQHWFTTDPTVESLAPMLQFNAGVAAAFDELVAWARGCNAYKKGGNDRQKYLELWNGRPLKVDRRTQGVLYVPDPVCCLVGGIQPERLPELTREASVHDGLLQRFCWTYPDVPSQGWSWDERESDDLEAMVALMRQLRHTPALVLKIHPAARDRWAEWYDDLRVSQQHLPPLAREMVNKLPAHLATLWLVLQALHDPEGHEQFALPVCLDAALALVDYFQAHARRVLVHFGTAAPHVDSGLIGRVARILRKHSGWIGKTELWAALHRNVKADALDAALHALLAEGRVGTMTEGSGPEQRTLWHWVEPDDAQEAVDPQATNSYEATNQSVPSDTTSFGSYELASMDLENAKDDDTCCLCSGPLEPGRRYTCVPCGEAGVRRNAALFGEEVYG